MTDLPQGLTRRWALPANNADTTGGLLERVLAARGYTDPDTRDAFLKGSLNDLPNPETLPGCTQAANTLLQATNNGTPITIYGDFDVDGITATAILWHTLHAINPNVDLQSYIPHRLQEGYGLNADALRQLAAAGRKLIVTVDCGVTALKEAALAKELGLELIITDHHTLHATDPLPEAAAIVHPGLPDANYAFTELAGAGVAWKLALLTAQQHVGAPKVTDTLRDTLMDCLALAALGTVADVMPLIDENRRIVSVGLRHIGSCAIPGVQALIRACTKPGERVDAETVGYRIGPRLNAAGRLDHAREAVELLTTATDDNAPSLAKALDKLNITRQQMVRTLTDEAIDAAKAAGMTAPDQRIIVLTGTSDTWHRGILGITCSRLAEQFNRPVIMLRQESDADGGGLGGSSRSVTGFNLYKALEHCSDLLGEWGGHPMAAGLSLQAENLDVFIEQISAWANDHIEEAALTPTITVDCLAQTGDLDDNSVGMLDQLAPFGRGNPRPRVLLKSAVIRKSRLFGKQDAKHHVSLTLDVGTTRRQLLDAVWWSAKQHIDELAVGVEVDVVGAVAIDSYTGGVRVTIDDIALV